MFFTPSNNADNFLLQDNVTLLFLHLASLRESFVFQRLSYLFDFKPGIFPFLFHVTHLKQLLDYYPRIFPIFYF